MRRGRYERVPSKANRRSAGKQSKRRKLNKYFLVTLSLLLVLGMGVGATVAYLVADSDTVTNTFEPGHVGCDVVKNSDGTFTVKPDSDTNTDVYLRATVVANWVDGDGNVYWKAPTVAVTPNNFTQNSSDGYYYSPKITLGSVTECTLTVELAQGETAPNGYDLQIDVLGEAIQAEPSNAVSDAWGFVPAG